MIRTEIKNLVDLFIHSLRNSTLIQASQTTGFFVFNWCQFVQIAQLSSPYFSFALKCPVCLSYRKIYFTEILSAGLSAVNGFPFSTSYHKLSLVYFPNINFCPVKIMS